MKIGLLCDQGCEAFVASEVKRLVKKEATCGNGFLTAELSPEEMALLNYKSQTIHRLIAVIYDRRDRLARRYPFGKRVVAHLRFFAFQKQRWYLPRQL
jgi:23S rRNA G2445 N2-methylase RlmL